MNLRRLYQGVGTISMEWEGVTRHFRENVRVFSRAVVRARSSQVPEIAGVSRRGRSFHISSIGVVSRRLMICRLVDMTIRHGALQPVL